MEIAEDEEEDAPAGEAKPLAPPDEPPPETLTPEQELEREREARKADQAELASMKQAKALEALRADTVTMIASNSPIPRDAAATIAAAFPDTVSLADRTAILRAITSGLPTAPSALRHHQQDDLRPAGRSLSDFRKTHGIY